MLRATTQVDYPYFPFRIPVDYVLVSRTDNLSRQYHRTLFERAAKKEGLIIQHEYAGPICFTLISTPFHRLCREAEKMQLSFPLKDCPVNPAAPACCVTLSNLFVTDDTVDYISAPFNRRNGELFLNYGNEMLFFTSAQRDMLTHEILTQIDISRELVEADQREAGTDEESQQSVIDDEPLKRKGLQYLRMENSYEDSFILHEPSKEEPYFRKMRENSFVTYLELMQEIEKDPRKKLSDLWSSVRLSPATFGNCTVINYAGKTDIVPCSLRNEFVFILFDNLNF
ncbi:hypothetical protein ANCDUO_02984 [Ancylostoma duodenale]|uniref:Anoctamin dimerisation domain-containing protein n=1 Tax=Ancylostoma duodenale TaxID=51022 RepID=A0A0C2HB01_9BILA|nr:hypothetical protein ANCDUO_02984 [Ancylostoma duodenale]